MLKKKDCMFQYAIAYRWISTDIVEDTDLITLQEARELWYKYLPDFIKHMNNRDEEASRPEMVIWIDCKDNTDYSKELAHIDWESEVDGNSVYNITRTRINV